MIELGISWGHQNLWSYRECQRERSDTDNYQGGTPRVQRTDSFLSGYIQDQSNGIRPSHRTMLNKLDSRFGVLERIL